VLAPIELPPGCFRNGTEYQSKGRVYDTNLVRWYGRAIGPIGGWVERTTTGATISGAPRAIFAWADNGGSRWGAIGTHTHLFAFSPDNVVTDITPSGFTSGRASSTAKRGYGMGLYGRGLYGTPRPDTGDPLPASVWDLFNWGEYLVACCDSDGDIYEWDGDPMNDAVIITNAPTDNTGIVVTPELTLMALGAGGDPRRVEWSDTTDNTDWTPSATSKAGGFSLQTQGALMAGRKVPGKTLILTTVDAWTATFNGTVFFYSWDQVGTDCGLIARGAVCQAGNFAVWWGQSGFYKYDGGFTNIPCDVWEFLQKNLNTAQRSKITVHHNSKFNEIIWDYPSISSTENDAYVAWHYPTAADPRSFWILGLRSRTAAMGPGVFSGPIAIDIDGDIFDHEVGNMYDDVSPFFRAGPLEVGVGDRVGRVSKIIPDELTVGEASVSFRNRFYPNGEETILGETVLTDAGKSDLRFTARQTEMVVTFVNDNAARWGTPRLDVTEGGRR
jgi:hypothetical protein